jgi:glycosyltransferase involved in cell wall biosynthesis
MIAATDQTTLDLAVAVTEQPRTILFVHNGATQFVRQDLDELRKKYQVTEYCLHSRWMNPVKVWRQVGRHSLVFGWFASWHTFLPLLFSRLLGKPSVLIVGGYDVAKMPVIDYGHQRGGMKKWVSRWTMRLATRLITTSRYSESEAVTNASIPGRLPRTIYLGVPDHFATLPPGPRARLVLTVGNVSRSNLQRKGHEPFVRTAALMPDVNFVLVGDWKDDAIDHLRAIATPNVSFTGRVSDEVLFDYYRRASIYVQASLHEGFGLSVAEAMLAGCVPVINRVGSLPEVTGNSCAFVDQPEPAALAEAIEKALTYPEEVRASIRKRILDEFPMAKRAQLLEELISPLMNATN